MFNEDELRATISSNLKRFREEKGLSQAELGNIIGKAKTTISTWERGESLPDAAMLYRLAAYYGKIMEAMYEKDTTASNKKESAS